ncbi:hypothetical protein [Streptomyces flavidovirens]|uniref:hypothetical protein n=1 Tax=Streptomyces flavidovirens TaxID=67298 RepID=UPI0036A31BDD
MRKIPTLFVRDFDARPALVLPEVTSGCEWVIAGEGKATRKWDGTCVMLDASGEWWARREVKPGKTPPPRFAQISFDPETGKAVGWEPMAQSSYAKIHAEAAGIHHNWPHGTYELCGPKINGNPEGLERHTLIRHATAEQLDPDFDERTFEGVADFLRRHQWEGLVFHHPDGRMAKIKARDFAPTKAQR